MDEAKADSIPLLGFLGCWDFAGGMGTVDALGRAVLGPVFPSLLGAKRTDLVAGSVCSAVTTFGTDPTGREELDDGFASSCVDGDGLAARATANTALQNSSS